MQCVSRDRIESECRDGWLLGPGKPSVKALSQGIGSCKGSSEDDEDKVSMRRTHLVLTVVPGLPLGFVNLLSYLLTCLLAYLLAGVETAIRPD